MNFNHPPLPPRLPPMQNDNMHMNNMDIKNEIPMNNCSGPGCGCCCFPQKSPELAYQIPPQKFPMSLPEQPFYNSMTPMNSPKSGFLHSQSPGFYPNPPTLPQMAYNFPPPSTAFCSPHPSPNQIQPPPPYFPNQFPNFPSPPPPYFNGGPQNQKQQLQPSQYRPNINNNNNNFNINNNKKNNNTNNNPQGLQKIPSPITKPETPTSFNNCSFYYSGIPSLNPWHAARQHKYRNGINSAAGDDQLAPVPRLFKSELRKGTMYFGLGKSCYCKHRPCTTARPSTKYQDQYFKVCSPNSGNYQNNNIDRFGKNSSRGRKVYEWSEDELQPQQNHEGKGLIDRLSLSTYYKTGRENNHMNNVLNNLYQNTSNRNNINGATTTNQLYINCNVQVPTPDLYHTHFCQKCPDEYAQNDDDIDIDNDYDEDYEDQGNIIPNSNNFIRWKQHNIEDFKRHEMINNYYNKKESRLLVEQNGSLSSYKRISTAKNNRYRNTFFVPAPNPQSISKHDESNKTEEEECKENAENGVAKVKVLEDSSTSTNDLSLEIVQDEDDENLAGQECRGRDRTKKLNNRNRQKHGQIKSQVSMRENSLNISSTLTTTTTSIYSANSQDTLMNAPDNLSSHTSSLEKINEVDENSLRIKTALVESKEFNHVHRNNNDSNNCDTDDDDDNDNDENDKSKNKELLEIFRPMEPKKESSSFLIVSPPLLSLRSGIGKTQSGPFAHIRNHHNVQKETNEILNERKTVSMFPMKRHRRKSARHCHHKVYIPKFNNHPNQTSDHNQNNNNKVHSKSNHENNDENELNADSNKNADGSIINEDHVSAEVLVKKKSSWDNKSKEEINYAEHNYCVMPVTICVKNRCCSPCCKPCCSPRCSPARVTVWQTFPFNCTPSCNTTGCGPCCSPCCPQPPTPQCRPVCCCPIGPPPIPPANRPTCCTPPPCPPPRCPERCKKPTCCKPNARCCRSCSPCFTERSCCNSRSASPCCRPRSCSPCSTICPCPPKPCCPFPPKPCCPPCSPCCPPKCCRRKRCPSPCPCPEPCCIVCPPPCPPKCCPKPKCCTSRCCSPPPCCPPRCCSPPPCCPPCCPPRPRRRCCRVDRCCSPCSPPCSPCPPCCPPPRPPPCCPRRPPKCCPPPCCPFPCPCPPPPCIPAPCPSPCKKKRRRRKCCCCCCPKEHIPLPQSTIIRCCPIPQACCCVNPCLCNVPCPQMCCH